MTADIGISRQCITPLGKKGFPLPSQIGFAHGGVGQQVGGAVFAHHLAYFQHITAGGQAQGGAGVLLHQQHGNAAFIDGPHGFKDGAHQQGGQAQRGFVQQEQARLAELTEQNRQQEQQAATLGSKIEKIQNQRVDVRSIEKIVATSIPFSSKVAVEREDFDRLSTLAKKYVTAEKKESKLQKALDAANKLIVKLKAEIDGLKQEISDYKSVRSKLRAAELERENTELRGKVRSYEDVIQRNNLWRFFHPHREKAVTRDEAR